MVCNGLVTGLCHTTLISGVLLVLLPVLQTDRGTRARHVAQGHDAEFFKRSQDRFGFIRGIEMSIGDEPMEADIDLAIGAVKLRLSHQAEPCVAPLPTMAVGEFHHLLIASY